MASRKLSGSHRRALSCPIGAGLAALVMLLVFRKDRLRITFFDRHVPASRYLLAALIPTGGAVLIYLIYRLFFGAPAAGA